jgi:sugar phosphate isomerase/epimerase
MLQNYRGRFPFRLATTSYIYPDKIVPNVARLAPSFDEIELVFFESESQDNLLHEEEIKALIDLSSRHGLTYHIHLPLDIFLGDEDELIRTKGISTVQGMIERTLPLNPSIYTLHLERKSRDGIAEPDVEAWKGRILQSLEEIVRCELESKRISIETLEYPFEWVEEIVEELKLSICLDIGHLLTHGQDLGSYLGKYLANTSIVHLHGFQNKVDHLGIDQLPELALELIMTHLRDYHGIVSLEVFSIDDLKKSLITLEGKWGKR